MGMRKRRPLFNRHKVAKAHRHKAERDAKADVTLPLCSSVPLSLRRSASADSRLLEGEFVFSEKADASLDHIRVIKAALLVHDFLQGFIKT